MILSSDKITNNSMKNAEFYEKFKFIESHISLHLDHNCPMAKVLCSEHHWLTIK